MEMVTLLMNKSSVSIRKSAEKVGAAALGAGLLSQLLKKLRQESQKFKASLGNFDPNFVIKGWAGEGDIPGVMILESRYRIPGAGEPQSKRTV